MLCTLRNVRPVGSFVNSSAADTDVTAATADGDSRTHAGDWTVSLQLASVERHDVEAEAIAACRQLSDQPPDLTLAGQIQPQETKHLGTASKSTSEFCVAQALASLSTSSGDAHLGRPHVPIVSSCTVSSKNTSQTRRRQTSARKNDSRDKHRLNSQNSVVKTTGDGRSTGLNTINVSDASWLSIPVHASSANSVYTHSTISTVSCAASVSQLVNVTSSVMSVVVPTESSSKHSYFRPMKRASEVNITYDETSRRYVQTVKRSTDRQKSLGFPGYQSNAGDTACRISLPISVVINGSENETVNTANGVRGRRLSLKKGNDVVSPPAGDLSSMEIVMRCCLGESEPTAVDPGQPSSAVNTTQHDVNSATRRPRTTRSSSRPAGKVSKCSAVDSEPVLLTGNSTVAEEEDQLLSGNKPRRRTKKNGTIVEKSEDSKKNTGKGHAIKNRSKKVQNQTSVCESSNSSRSPLGSAELNTTKKQRGRQKAEKPTETLKEKERRGTKRTSKNKAKSPSKAPSSSRDLLSSPIRQKRRTSSLSAGNETAHSSKQPVANSTVRLPNFNCFLTAATKNNVEHVDHKTGTVTETCTSDRISQTVDDSMQQNSSTSTQYIVPSVSSTVAVVSEETVEYSLPDCGVVAALLPTSSTDCQMSSTAVAPRSSSVDSSAVKSADTDVPEHSVDDTRCVAVSNVGLQEPECDSISSQHSSHSVENDINISSSVTGQ